MNLMKYWKGAKMITNKINAKKIVTTANGHD